MLFSPFSPEMIAAMGQSNIIMVIAAEIEFESGTSRIHSGQGLLLIDGKQFVGVGNIGKTGAVSEENSTSPTKMSLVLSGLDNNLLSTAMLERCVNKNVTVYLVVLNDLHDVIAENMLYRGFISESSIVAGSTSGISYTVSNVFEKWAFGLTDRFTDQSQRTRHNGDRVFRYVSQMSDKSIYWGSKKDAPPFARYD